jgi:CIC family chloride channel protein
MTIGSGGNGGTFAPSLFTGAMIGGIFGQIVNIYFPEYSAQPGAYALVGMGAVVAGTTNASLTALIMVFEMTNNYKIILPLMLTIIISTTVAKSILGGSLYTLKFKREGKEIDIYGRKVSILKNILVKEMIERNNDLIYEHMNFHQILDTIKNAKYNSILVKNKNNELVGEITFQDIRDGALSEETKHIANFLIAKDIMTKNYISIYESDDCDIALKKLESGDYDFLPVLGKKDDRLLGVISRQALVNRYQKELFVMQSKDELD